MKFQLSKHERSKMVIMTDEARILKRLREEAGLSLREVGRRLGKSHTTIVHIETGRMDPPTGKRLMEILRLYGIDNYKSFYDRVYNFHQRLAPKDELKELADKLSDDRIAIVLQVAKRVAEGKAILAF